MQSEEPIKCTLISPFEPSNNESATIAPKTDPTSNEHPIDESNQTSETIPINSSTKINIEHHRYPYCIVWTPIPLITTLFPTIGHTGICTSNGIIHDFACSYLVSIDNMAFGNPYKYVILSPSETECSNWNKAIKEGDDFYNTQSHDLFCNNCHSHCAYVLNKLNYNNKSTYTMFHIWWMLITKGKYISCKHIIKTYLGFLIIVLLIVGIYFLIKFYPTLPLS